MTTTHLVFFFFKGASGSGTTPFSAPPIIHRAEWRPLHPASWRPKHKANWREVNR